MTMASQDAALEAGYRRVTREVTRIPLAFPHKRTWWIAFLAALSLLALYLVSACVTFAVGIGAWGNDIPVNWGIAISNYIWWIGIGHAGTLISAMLLLMRQRWRNSLNRFAEAMTLFAVVCGGLYPILHLGRPWFFYWMAPYPATMGVWPQFKSPLTWDFFAVLTYLTVSALFWYIGIIPDLAATRDRATRHSAQVFFGVLALGWRGAARHWARWRQAYRICAAIAVPLVVSVHSEISMIFAAGPVPGWMSTVFPPYFVLGAAFSGFAVVAIIATVTRHAFGLKDLITDLHLDMLGRLTLATGMMTAYGYFADVFGALYGGERYELHTLHERFFGEVAWAYWGAVILNFVPLQLLWLRRWRVNPIALLLVGFSVTVGMWCERYMLLVTTLYRDYLVSSWGHFWPSFWEWGLFFGSIGLWLTLFLLFIRALPMISAFEIKEATFEEEEAEAAHG
ncbi:MAG TPA: NrfD/PsrC family molybdoenzyme membrane anchor subunit [Phenylobacterium sp.]|uniref:NrfD/PsrC family molybdoenzyme membrane anchor subunit n=1 Tax=Phenylobacterium sp. TaxID=1871053 RepID=UPI002D6544F6|nr:NrfD/PsrC family molybdoenzyme membrane anchor subunit [Phenylobacterium sp.]HZZ70315.1 NrfD/PsrC family molybdoenzyme membrane anchor subunit [Phenylobacterium sp.]